MANRKKAPEAPAAEITEQTAEQAPEAPAARLSAAEQQHGRLITLPGGNKAHARLYQNEVPVPGNYTGEVKVVDMVAIVNPRDLGQTDYRVSMLPKSYPDLHAALVAQGVLEEPAELQEDAA